MSVEWQAIRRGPAFVWFCRVQMVASKRVRRVRPFGASGASRCVCSLLSPTCDLVSDLRFVQYLYNLYV